MSVSERLREPEYYRSRKTLSASEKLNERGSFVKNEHGGIKRNGGSVMNKPDANMRNDSVTPEHTRPIFPAVRAILSLFTQMKTV